MSQKSRSFQATLTSWLQQPQGRAIAGIGAIVVVALIAGSIYFFGIGGSKGTGTLTTPTLVADKDSTIFTIDSSSSTASFTIDEILFGNPNTVVGKTNQVAGQIQVNTTDPTKSKIGQIEIDLSTLATDNNLRNSTIQHRILEADQSANQFAIFVPSAITGLPATITTGQQLSLKVQGNLTIHQVTRAVTFDAQVTMQSATLLSGKATTTIAYKDYGIAIPSVPSVSGVSDDVTLALDFTAHA